MFLELSKNEIKDKLKINILFLIIKHYMILLILHIITLLIL